jgi:fumarate reductase subunit D
MIFIILIAMAMLPLVEALIKIIDRGLGFPQLERTIGQIIDYTLLIISTITVLISGLVVISSILLIGGGIIYYNIVYI